MLTIPILLAKLESTGFQVSLSGLYSYAADRLEETRYIFPSPCPAVSMM